MGWGWFRCQMGVWPSNAIFLTTKNTKFIHRKGRKGIALLSWVGVAWRIFRCQLGVRLSYAISETAVLSD